MSIIPHIGWLTTSNSMGLHDHALHMRGLSHGVFQRLGDVCPKPNTNHYEFMWGVLHNLDGIELVNNA
jgi:hypothetical protein